MSQEGKFVLESILGKLLGFDEGAGDLLNHLLTIESEEDLKEYLSQLLGSETPETKEFAINVGRYQRGEEVVYTMEKEDEKKEDGESKPRTNQVSQASNSATNKSNNNNNNNKTNKKEALQARKNQKKGKVPPPSRKTATAAPQTSSQAVATKPAPLAPPSSTAATPPNAQSASMTTKPVPPPVKKSIPQRGKAKFVCGCMGNRDKPLTNCLYCGRIVCEREGYGYCPYCGYLIEEIEQQAAANDPSWAQKERLLRFDREFARRTKIFDDQADFQGGPSSGTWMSEEERAAAEQKQVQRLEEMRRPKQVMNLNI